MFRKIRFLINKIIAGRERRSKRYSTKNVLFNILNLADQLY